MTLGKGCIWSVGEGKLNKQNLRSNQLIIRTSHRKFLSGNEYKAVGKVTNPVRIIPVKKICNLFAFPRIIEPDAIHLLSTISI